MPYYSGTPDSVNERQAENQANNYYLVENLNSPNTRPPTTEDQNSSQRSIVNYIQQGVISVATQTGITAVIKNLKGGAAVAAGGSTIVEEAVPVVESIAEIGTVFL